MKNKGPLFWMFLFVLLTLTATMQGCGIWEDITGSDDNEVTLKGESGASCSLDSECRSNSCTYPGICE
jgi:hypothetical protein